MYVNEFKNWIAGRRGTVVGFDTETTSLDWYELKIEGFSLYDGCNSIYVDLIDNIDTPQIMKLLDQVLNSSKLVIMHNAVYDLGVLRKYNMNVNVPIFCTAVGSFILDEVRNTGLKYLTEKLLKKTVVKYDDVKDISHSSDEFYQYGMDDAINCYELWELFAPQIEAEGLSKAFYEIDMPFIHVIVDMKVNGIAVDMQEYNRIEPLCRNLMYEYTCKLHELAGIEYDVVDGEVNSFLNLNATDDLIMIIESLGIEITEVTKKGKKSVGIDSLNAMGTHPFIEVLKKYKKLSKIYSSFIKPFKSFVDPDGRIRCNLNNTVARTSRLSCSKPNLQQCPKGSSEFGFNFRDLFVAPEGKKLGAGDYEGQELRLLGDLTQDFNLLKAFADNMDLHLMLANKMLGLGLPLEYMYKEAPNYEEIKERFKGQRFKAKSSVSFPIIYGTSQPLDAKVMTPEGFVNMGDIHSGDTVMSEMGKPVKVMGVFPQGVRPVYQLVMKDGSKTTCDEKHLWTIQTIYDKEIGRTRTLPLKDLIPILKMGNKRPQNNCYIQYCEPIQFKKANLIIPPYLMGMFIGDGSARGGSFKITQSKQRQVIKMANHTPEDYYMTSCGIEHIFHNGKHRDTLKRFSSGNRMLNKIREYGLHLVKSETKFIPKEYLISSSSQRFLLLEGLIDSDGTENNGAFEYDTTSKQLSEDIIFLVRSLGGRASVTQRKAQGPREHKGRIINNKHDMYRVFISFPPHRQANSIDSIKYVGEMKCQCISVDNPTGLYITDDLIVTHNTAYGVAKSLGVPEYKAQGYIDSFFQLFPAVKKAMFRCNLELQNCKYVRNKTGRKRRFKFINNKAKRQAFNFKIQGSAADMIKAAMIKFRAIILNNPEWGALIVLTVHDEIVVEALEEHIETVHKALDYAMLSAYPLTVPLKVESLVGNNYGECK